MALFIKIESIKEKKVRRRTRSLLRLTVGSTIVVGLVSACSLLRGVNCWSLSLYRTTKTTTTTLKTKSLDVPFISSSLSPSSDGDEESPLPLLQASEICPSLSLTSSRRSVLSTTVASSLSLFSLGATNNAYAALTIHNENDELYKRKLNVLTNKELTYQIAIPSSMKESSKPVKTHLDEVNFRSESTKGYQYGITVDPVRISSLKEFGTPEEVAARVVTAEVNRDGVFDVTLLEDPYRTTQTTASSTTVDAYVLKYLSVGKRGRKIYTNKIVISPNQLLYVLTAQCKEENFPAEEKEIKNTVESFQIISS